ncbi:MAG: IscA/HesB family protein [Desulfovibrionaceae bacterium]|nr:IscA/HesB family protein [Desulfovibrionaceae bacterium]
MVEITEAARRELDGYFADKEKAPIRIYLSAGGCSGPRLALALDEAKDTDDLFDVDGYNFIVDKELSAQAAPMRVDMSYMGFTVQSSLQLGDGGCGCSGGSCSSGSCGTPGSCCS